MHSAASVIVPPLSDYEEALALLRQRKLNPDAPFSGKDLYQLLRQTASGTTTLPAAVFSKLSPHLTRAQAAWVILQMTHIPFDRSAIKRTKDPLQRAILTARKLSILRGYGNTGFLAPEDPVTRVQFQTMLLRAQRIAATLVPAFSSSSR
jgi:hypothetical protein